MVKVCLRQFHLQREEQGQINGAHGPQEVREHNLTVMQVIILPHDCQKIFPHQQLIQRDLMLLKQPKQRCPVHILVHHQASQSLVFLLMQLQFPTKDTFIIE